MNFTLISSDTKNKHSTADKSKIVHILTSTSMIFAKGHVHAPSQVIFPRYLYNISK